MRFCSINIFSGEQHDGIRKKKLTGMLRKDSDCVLDAYLKSFKYYSNDNCISLNISCDEDISKPFVEDFANGYPILHIPFDLDSYERIQACDRNKFWLTIVHESIEYVSSIWNWEKEFFDDVYSRSMILLDTDI